MLKLTVPVGVPREDGDPVTVAVIVPLPPEDVGACTVSVTVDGASVTCSVPVTLPALKKWPEGYATFTL